MTTPLVSIVVPVFNGMPYLATALESVAQQTYPNIELLITDGGSTDESQRFLSDSGYDFDIDSAQQGASHTWTHVTQRAHGDYIMLLCQDDVLYPDAVSQHVEGLQAAPDAAVSIAQRDIIDARSRRLWSARGLGNLASGVLSGAAVLRECFRQGTNIIGEPHCIMFRREDLLMAMPWDGALPYLLDLATYTKVLEREGALAVINRDSRGAFRVSANSWSTRLTSLQLSQMQAWQRTFAQVMGLSSKELSGALRASRKQAFIRNQVYRYLSARKRLTPA